MNVHEIYITGIVSRIETALGDITVGDAVEALAYASAAVCASSEQAAAAASGEEDITEGGAGQGGNQGGGTTGGELEG